MKKIYINFIWILIFNLPTQKVTANYLFKNNNNLNDNFDSNLLDNSIYNSKWNTPIKIDYLFGILKANVDDRQNAIEKSLTILSDRTSYVNEKTIAEGNVFVKKNDLIFRADKLSYDKKINVLLLNGNIIFRTKNQFLIASEIKFNFDENKGYIKDAYGTIDFRTIGLIDPNIESGNNLSEKDLNNKDINKVSLNSTNNIRLGNLSFSSEEKSLLRKITDQRIDVSINQMEKWRFKSNFININSNVWTADTLYLTNDPYNQAQLIIKNKGFKSITDETGTLIKSKLSKLILENNLEIPIAASRYKIGEEEEGSRWGIAYDWAQKDGLFITRDFRKLNSKDNKTNLKLTKEFYIQRAILGKTNSFNEKNDPILAPNQTQEPLWNDLFGLSGRFRSEILGFSFDSKFSLNSLDLDKLHKAAKVKSKLSRVIYEKVKDDFNKNTELSLFKNYRESIWNGSLGERQIISAHGIKLAKKNNWKNNDVIKSSEIAFAYGRYNSNKKDYPTISIYRNRLNILMERNHSYPLWRPEIDEEISSDYIYSPSVVQQGLFFNTQAKIDLYRYSDNNYQDLYTLKGGPQLTLGKFKNKIFDYTELSIYPKVTFANGNSSFDFDQAVDNHAIEINLKQQIIGPVTAEITSEYNLDINSTKYRKFFNTKYEISWNRRAYNFSAFYNRDNKSGGINFEFYSFNFGGLGKLF